MGGFSKVRTDVHTKIAHVPQIAKQPRAKPRGPSDAQRAPKVQREEGGKERKKQKAHNQTTNK